MPFNLLNNWLEEERVAGAPNPQQAVLAIAGFDAIPHSRVVAIREISEKGLLFFTQKGTKKANELKLLGVRFKAGNCNRIFENNETFGQPVFSYSHTDPKPISLTYDNPVLPSAVKNIYRDDLNYSVEENSVLFLSLHELTSKNAKLLLCAAKLYRDALWLIETEPQLALIMLVSAVETIACEHINQKRDPEEFLHENDPELVDVLMKKGGHIKKTIQSVARFYLNINTIC